MNENHTIAARDIAEIANQINTHLDSVFKNNAGMVTKLAIVVFEATLTVPDVSDSELKKTIQALGKK